MSAFIRFAEGDVDAVASALAQVVGEEISDDGGRAIGVALWSELAVALDAIDLCRTLADSIAHQGGVHFLTGGIYLGAVDRIRALLHDALGEHDLADELFALAVEQHEALRSPTWVARTQLDWAESLLRRGEVEPAGVSRLGRRCHRRSRSDRQPPPTGGADRTDDDNVSSETTVGTVTVMFTDLVGSTEIRSRVGEDAAEVLRAVHDEVLTEAIGSNGGQVVKHLGDGLMATFTSAAGAVAAAVAMQQELDLRNRRSDAERMQIRVGISIGDVTFDGDDCFGLPVVEAQRLEASAEPATIRCAEMVTLMSRGRGGHEFRPIGELELKGLAEPLPACEVLWSPIAEPQTASVEMGLPPVFAHGTGLPFSGREDVFEQLVDAWKRCATGGFEVVLLAGEPGIGKTRLAQELAVRVHSGNGIVLGGRSDEDVTLPFQAFGAALDWYVRQTDPEDRLDRLGEFPGDLTRIVPELGRLVDKLPPALDDEPDVERFRLFQAVTSWLSVGDVDRPRLLVLDDLHWADKPTLLLLRHLISNPLSGLMVLCTYRDTDVDRTHPLSSMLADFRRLPAVSRIALDGLASDGVRDLLTRTGGHELDEQGLAFAEVVFRETSGNPFFLGEVLRHLSETGALYERDGRWVSDLSPEDAGIPEGIREVVGRRLSRLGGDVEGVLRSAAVIGYEFDIDLLADVVGRDPDDVLDALDTAQAANLVIEIGVDRHRFAHALVRETLHGELSSSRRARQHRKVAEALEARHADDIDTVITELATHWAEASAGGDPTRAIELALRAGDLAADRGAHENALRWFEQALDLMDDDPSSRLHRESLVKLAQMQVFVGFSSEGRQNSLIAARAGIEARDAETASSAAAVGTRVSFDSSEPPDQERTAVLRQVLELDLTDQQRAGVLAHLAVELIYERDIDGRAEAVEEWRSIVETFPLLEQVRAFGPGIASYRSTKDELIEHLRRVMNVIELMAPTERLRRQRESWFTALRTGDRISMDELMSLNPNDQHESGFFRAFGLVSEVTDLTVLGDLDRAAEGRSEMLAEFETRSAPGALAYGATTALALAREYGSFDELEPLLDLMEQMGHPTSAPRAIAAFVRFAGGDNVGVVATLDALADERFADDAGLPLELALWGEIAADLELDRHCRRFISELTSLSGTQIATGGILLGAADRLLAKLHGALDEHDVADRYFALAVEQHEVLRSPPWVARTHLDWAESLLARDRAADASAQLDLAEAAIGDLDLPDNQQRLAALSARLAP